MAKVYPIKGMNAYIGLTASAMEYVEEGMSHEHDLYFHDNKKKILINVKTDSETAILISATVYDEKTKRYVPMLFNQAMFHEYFVFEYYDTLEENLLEEDLFQDIKFPITEDDEVVKIVYKDCYPIEQLEFSGTSLIKIFERILNSINANAGEEEVYSAIDFLEQVYELIDDDLEPMLSNMINLLYSINRSCYG